MTRDQRITQLENTEVKVTAIDVDTLESKLRLSIWRGPRFFPRAWFASLVLSRQQALALRDAIDHALGEGPPCR
jgi:hypothetical protein